MADRINRIERAFRAGRPIDEAIARAVREVPSPRPGRRRRAAAKTPRAVRVAPGSAIKPRGR